MDKITEQALSAIKYIISVFMMFYGVARAFGPIKPLDGDLGVLYSSRLFLVIMGIIFFASGLVLLLGKINRRKKMVGYGLGLVYLCFLFGTVINGMATDWRFAAWGPNLLCTIIVGVLWLRWKFKTEYVDPKHFIDDLDDLEFRGHSR